MGTVLCYGPFQMELDLMILMSPFHLRIFCFYKMCFKMPLEILFYFFLLTKRSNCDNGGCMQKYSDAMHAP